MLQTLKALCFDFKLILQIFKLLLFKFYGYLLVIFGFIAFLIINGSIVVGDKSAHEAAVHVPQVNK